MLLEMPKHWYTRLLGLAFNTHPLHQPLANGHVSDSSSSSSSSSSSRKHVRMEYRNWVWVNSAKTRANPKRP
ncbi:hypothetical protein K0M31_014909, partial [Melipona bicolor]